MNECQSNSQHTSLILENFVDLGFIAIHIHVIQQKPHFQFDSLISLFN